MRHMYGVEIQVPDGKLPGFYAQVIHKIGDDVNVFDRDKLLFVVEGEEDRDKLEAILARPNMLGDVFSLLLLPEAIEMASLEDIGFLSQNGHLYLYAERVALFTLSDDKGSEKDRWAAEEQLREHVHGQFSDPSTFSTVFIIDSSLPDLVEGIARAYQLSVRWVHRGDHV
ncbi:hypothetical protein [Brevibacillus choshinensis]|uniref:DUF4265 domain-containing protein n=1 Tax=Brevibacillus choshinensis TaxID=54911 RepID=A0ABX7FJJ6_BRECH|nr:hypothetical protein [Brevibacillus choshinensis]QRG65795.1 hypothetical protein JNE38_19640 [Brevibacillus choshinensis]